MDDLDASNPLIWTAAGYVREQDMQHTVEWQTVERHVPPAWWQFWRLGVGHLVFAGIILIDRFHLNGELVKESRHIYKADGLAAEGQSQELPK